MITQELLKEIFDYKGAFYTIKLGHQIPLTSEIKLVT